MKIKVIPIVVGALETVPKRLGKRWEKVWKIRKSEGESRPSRILHCCNRLEYSEEFWRPEETCCHSASSEIPSANADVKNSKGVKIIIIIIGLANIEDCVETTRFLVRYQSSPTQRMSSTAI